MQSFSPAIATAGMVVKDGEQTTVVRHIIQAKITPRSVRNERINFNRIVGARPQIYEADEDQVDDAMRQYLEAIRLKPDYAEAHNNYGSALGRKGRLDEAIREFQEAIRLKPDYVQARNNLATALEMKNAPSDR